MMLKTMLIVLGLLYLLAGMALTAFCVHMSYHESAVGYGDDDDLKAQRMLEGKLGLLGFLFLFLFWPVALLISIAARKPNAANTKGAEKEKEERGA